MTQKEIKVSTSQRYSRYETLYDIKITMGSNFGDDWIYIKLNINNSENSSTHGPYALQNGTGEQSENIQLSAGTYTVDITDNPSSPYEILSATWKIEQKIGENDFEELISGSGETGSFNFSIPVDGSSEPEPEPETQDGLDLFFSEYGLGTGNNKWFEIYNPTSNTISLNNYAFPTALNRSDGLYSDWEKFTDGATIDAGDVYVLAHNRQTKPLKERDKFIIP